MLETYDGLAIYLRTLLECSLADAWICWHMISETMPLHHQFFRVCLGWLSHVCHFMPLDKCITWTLCQSPEELIYLGMWVVDDLDAVAVYMGLSDVDTLSLFWRKRPGLRTQFCIWLTFVQVIVGLLGYCNTQRVLLHNKLLCWTTHLALRPPTHLV